MLRWGFGSGLLVLALALAGCRADAVPPKVEAVEVTGTPGSAPQEVGPSASASVELPDAGPPRLRANVAVGPVTTTVPVPNVERAIAGLRPRFRACYTKQFDSDPSAAGDVDVTFELTPNGEVSSVSATPNGTLPEAVGACVVAVIKRATFDPPGPKGSTATMKLRMRPDTSKP